MSDFCVKHSATRDACEECLEEAKARTAKALDALHDIGSAYAARRFLFGTHNEPPRRLTAPLRESMEAKALTDEQIEKLALDTWEKIATEMTSKT